jgi:hypothetical protein
MDHFDAIVIGMGPALSQQVTGRSGEKIGEPACFVESRQEGERQGHASGPTRGRPTVSAFSKLSSMATRRRPAASRIEAAVLAR